MPHACGPRGGPLRHQFEDTTWPAGCLPGARFYLSRLPPNLPSRGLGRVFGYQEVGEQGDARKHAAYVCCKNQMGEACKSSHSGVWIMSSPRAETTTETAALFTSPGPISKARSSLGGVIKKVSSKDIRNSR